jgi:PAS domain S-box-containing protein
LFESAADAIFILEAEGEQTGNILKTNQAAAKMHGYSIEELLAMNIRDLDTPDAALGIPIRIEKLLAGERIQTMVNHRTKDGMVFPVEISAVYSRSAVINTSSRSTVTSPRKSRRRRLFKERTDQDGGRAGHRTGA